eukprot:348837-Rhodomonas_salina.1
MDHACRPLVVGHYPATKYKIAVSHPSCTQLLVCSKQKTQIHYWPTKKCVAVCRAPPLIPRIVLGSSRLLATSEKWADPLVQRQTGASPSSLVNV